MILRKGLLSLPTELRNQIYRLVVVVDEDNVGGVARDTAICISPIPYRSHVCDLTDWRYQPALTRVSRQVRAESLPVYYGENEFVAFAWFRTGKRFPDGGPDLDVAAWHGTCKHEAAPSLCGSGSLAARYWSLCGDEPEVPTLQVWYKCSADG